MILNTNALKKLWSEIVKVTCYLLNYSSTKITEKISIQLWYKSMNFNNNIKSTNLSYLWVWECKVYTYISKKRCQTSTKFNEQSEKNILVKYEKSNIFRIWLSNKEKIVQKWDIVFNENLIQNDKLTVIQSSISVSSSKQICQSSELECSASLSTDWEKKNNNNII